MNGSTQVLRTKNLDRSAKFRRKMVIQDISAGKTKREGVKILDHDGSLRAPQPEELLHRYQLHPGNRVKSL